MVSIGNICRGETFVEENVDFVPFSQFCYLRLSLVTSGGIISGRLMNANLRESLKIPFPFIALIF